MSWIQLKIASDQEHAEHLADMLHEAGAAAVTLEDAADQPIYEPPPGATPLWQQVCVAALFDAATDIDAVVARLPAGLSWRCEPLPDKDWERAWMDDFKPMRFGERLWICPSWCSPPDPAAVNLMLDPGLAFGSGTHPTTALCLEWLDRHPPHGQTVIDYGCGSGILAIAALKLGAAIAWGVDNDPQALISSRGNADKNSVGAGLHTCLPDELPAIKADKVIANILANPLITLAPRLAGLTRPGGVIVLSGILEEQQHSVARAYESFFAMAPAVTRDGWVRLEGIRY
ncbi:MAG: ribosomal protein L11 methyltransferase [Gammaproteobacteria bacterium RBG_16_57_12]|nr:MAG: ribosomal protein L11 methyltransferase [Gammaproteobacteria bacterium RBG_16_57_12]